MLDFFSEICGLRLNSTKTEAVKALQKSNEANFNSCNTACETTFDTCLKTTKRNRLTSKKQKNPVEAQRKWVTEWVLETQDNVDWKAVYRTPFLCTKITKLIVFQFKLLHRRLATNTFLTEVNLRGNEWCTFCKSDKETLTHLVWICDISNRFWQGF